MTRISNRTGQVVSQRRSALVPRQELKPWLTKVWRWINEPRVFWLTLILITLSTAVAWCGPGEHESRIRWIGLLLQLVGIGTVAYGIHATRRHFGLRSLLQTASLWFKRFPTHGRHRVAASFVIDAPFDLTPHRYAPPPQQTSDAPLSERLAALQNYVEALDTRLHRAEHQITIESAERRSALATAKASAGTADQEIRRLFTLAHTGGLNISAAGTVFLLLGTVMASLAGDFAKLL